MDAFELLRHRLRGTRARAKATPVPSDAGADSVGLSSGELWLELQAGVARSGLPYESLDVVGFWAVVRR